MKIREKLARLKRMFPHVSPNGQLYRTAEQTRARYKKITRYVLIESSENTHSIHATEFRKDPGKTPAEWKKWIDKHGFKIYTQSIIPGLQRRTQKFWNITQAFGWVGHDMDKSPRSSMGRKRHKAKSQRRKNGQTDLRRRHRNAKR